MLVVKRNKSLVWAFLLDIKSMSFAVVLQVGASGPTGGVVADLRVRAGAGLVVGEDGGEIAVATQAGK